MAENIYSYRYGDGNNQEDNEYPQGTLFLSLKPDEKLSDDEIKGRIDVLRFYMIDLSYRLEAESEDPLKERIMFPRKMYREREELADFLDNITSYETKTLFGAYIMFLEETDPYEYFDCRDNQNTYDEGFGSYYDLIVNHIYGVPTEETALCFLQFDTDETFSKNFDISVTEIKKLSYNFNAVKSVYKN